MKKLFCIFVLIVSGLSCYSDYSDVDTYIRTHYSISSGLPSTNIYCVTQDSIGAIWFGTDKGLSRFDGKSFYNYPLPDELGKSKIIDIEVSDKNHFLILLLNGKLYNFDGEHFHPSELNKDFEPFSISDIFFSKKYLIVGTKENGVFQCSDGEINRPKGKYPKQITKISRDQKGNHFITARHGVYMLSNDSLILITNNESLTYNSFFQQQRGNNWYSTRNDGIYRDISGKWKLIRNFDGNNVFAGLIIFDLFEDLNSEIWVSTNKGLYRIVDNMYREIYVFQELRNVKINKAFSDREGNIWAIASGKGVYKLQRHYFDNRSPQPGFSEESTKILVKDYTGKVWVQAPNEPLTRSDGCYLDRFWLKDWIGNRHILCASNVDTLVLFGGEQILMQYNGNEFSAYNYTGLPSRFIIKKLSKDIEGNVLAVLRNNDVWKFTDNKWEKINEISASPNINSIALDFWGRNWLATDNGIFTYEFGQFKQFHCNFFGDDAKINVVKTIADEVWIGLEHGLLILENDSIKQFITEKNGLHSNNVTALKLSTDHAIIGTDKGFAFYKNGSFTWFTSEDGLASNHIIGDNIEEIGGKTFMVTNNGYSMYYDWYNFNNPSIKVQLSSIKTNKDTVDFNLLNNDPDTLSLSAGTQNINLTYSLIDLKKYYKAYRYQLKEDEKIIVEENLKVPSISLINMNFGKYKLVLDGLGPSSEWTRLKEQFIIIKKPFYLRNGMLLLYMLIVFIVPIFVIRRKQNQQKNKYSTSSLSKSKESDLELNIRCLIEVEKVYKEPDISLAILSEKLNTSKEHISQVINKSYKQNFNSLINYYRIEEAKILLEQNKFKTIIEVAYEVGFNSKSAFNTAFKKFTGITPTQYKKNCD